LWWSQSSYDEDYNLQTVDGQDDGQVVILHIMLNMNPANKKKAFQKIVFLHDCEVSDK
jgi:hypothetical protein